MSRLRVEPRVTESVIAQYLVPVVAIALTLFSGTILFSFLGKAPSAVLYTFLIEPLTSRFGIGEVLLKMAPLLLIAQGLAIGFRARVWNIGAEGQLIMGGIFASVIAIHYNESESTLILPAMVFAGMLGGILWASIAAFLRVRFNANEILVTFMLSSVALQILYFLVTGPLRDPDGFNFPQSVVFADSALFGVLIEGTRANTSLLIGLTLSVLAYVFIRHSLPGFKLSVSGAAPRAARYAGFAESQAIWLGLIIGGAAAGLAGVGEVAGPIGQLQRTISPGYGFAGIIVAFLGGLHPIGICLAAFFMAILYVGGDMALISVGIPNAATTIFQGMLLIFYLASYLFVHYRISFQGRAAAT